LTRSERDGISVCNTADKGKPGKSRGRKATGPRTPSATPFETPRETPKTAELPDR